jgi:hypothetical protein
MLTLDDLLDAIAQLTPAQRQTFVQDFRRRWCIRGGRDVQAKTPCPCSKSGET